MGKPAEILAIEKEYKIILKEALTEHDILLRNTYQFNSDGEIFSINLSRNKITEIKNLEELKHLSELDLSGNQILEIKNLQGLKHLSELNLSGNQIEEIKNLGELKQLLTLDLSRNQIIEIKNLEELKQLKELNLSENEIKAIKNLEELKQLSELYLSSNQIEAIKNLEELKQLSELYLSSNQIEEIKNLEELKQLLTLDLLGNEITEITNLEELKQLSVLDLSENRIKEIKNLGELEDLSELYLYGNQITEIKNLERLNQLSELYLFSNQITEIKNLKELKQLSTLQLYGNQITEIKNLEMLKNLSGLYLSGNKITEIKNLEELKDLSMLDLYGNQILEIKNLQGLKHLSMLDLSGNQILEIKNLEELNQLSTLNLSDNKITEIKNLEALKQLSVLNLSGNNITEIKNLDALKQLLTLDLSENQIAEIKNLNELKDLSKINLSKNKIENAKNIIDFILEDNFKISVKEDDYHLHNKVISLKSNPLVSPPEKIIKKGTEEILKYFREINKYGFEKLYEGKLLIVGEPRQGKTSLRKKLFNIDYKIPEKEKLKETLGVEIQNNYFVKNYKDNEEINVNIWDFGGQEKQYPLHQYFLKDNSVFVLVSDDRKDNINLDKWIYKLKLLQGDNKETILLFNQINRTNDSTNFDAEKYRRLGFNFNDFYLDLSKDTERFFELKQQIDKSICDLAHMGKEYPGYCKIIADKIDEKRFAEKKNYLTIQEFEKICYELGYTDHEIVTNSLNYLDIVGKVIYYEDDMNLNHLIILNPHWLIDAIYGIITCKEIEDNNGRFNLQWFDSFMKKTSDAKTISYTKSESNNILKLMLKNQLDICYTLNNKEFVVPLLMPSILPNNIIDFKQNNLSLIFKYEVIPSGLVPRLIVRLSDYIKDNLISSNAGIIEKENSIAKIEEYDFKNDANKYIRITVIGENKIQLLNLIRNELIEIQKDWFENLEIQELIPCNCSDCKKNIDKNLYLKSDLIKRTKNNKYTIECQTSYDNVEILKLLGEVYDKKIIEFYTREELNKILNKSPRIDMNIERVFIETYGDKFKFANNSHFDKSQFGGKNNKQEN